MKQLSTIFILPLIIYSSLAQNSLSEPIRPQESDFYLRDRHQEVVDIVTSEDLFLKGHYPPYNISETTLGSIMTPEIERIAYCESRLNPNAVNNKDVHYNFKGEVISIGSFGILQFSQETFQEFCVDKYHLRDDLFSPLVQIECAKKMISEGYGERWSCYNIN